MTSELIFSVGGVISGAIVGALVSNWFYIKYGRRKIKWEALRRFMSNRYDLKGDEFSRALNEIFLAFNSSLKVMDALSEFHKKTIARDKNQEDTLVRLMKAMCDDMGLAYREFNDSFFLTPFNTRPSSAETSKLK